MYESGAQHSILGSVQGVPVGGNPVVDPHVYFGRVFLNLCTPNLNPIVEAPAAPTLQSTPDINIDTRHLHDSNTCWHNPSAVCTFGGKSDLHGLAKDTGALC